MAVTAHDNFVLNQAVFEEVGFQVFTNPVQLRANGIEFVESQDNYIQIAPNPSASTVYLWSSFYVQNGKIEIFDTKGSLKLAFEKQKINSEHPVVLDISTISSGLYLLRLTDDERNIYTTRLLKE